MIKELHITFAKGTGNEATMIVSQKSVLNDTDVKKVFHNKEAIEMYRVLTGNKEFVQPVKKGGEASECV